MVEHRIILIMKTAIYHNAWLLVTMLTSAFLLSISCQHWSCYCWSCTTFNCASPKGTSHQYTRSRLQFIHSAKCTSRLNTLQLAKCAKCLIYRNSRAGQPAMQSPGMSRGSPESNALQHAVTSSQPEISSPPAQVSSTHHYSA